MLVGAHAAINVALAVADSEEPSPSPQEERHEADCPQRLLIAPSSNGDQSAISASSASEHQLAISPPSPKIKALPSPPQLPLIQRDGAAPPPLLTTPESLPSSTPSPTVQGRSGLLRVLECASLSSLPLHRLMLAFFLSGLEVERRWGLPESEWRAFSHFVESSEGDCSLLYSLADEQIEVRR